jgi:hypothetical protein
MQHNITRDQLVLIKVNKKNVIGIVQYIMKDVVCVYVHHSFKVNRGSYLVERNQVRVIQ